MVCDPTKTPTVESEIVDKMKASLGSRNVGCDHGIQGTGLVACQHTDASLYVRVCFQLCVRLSADSECVYALKRRCVYAHGLIFHIDTQRATCFLRMRFAVVLAGVCDKHCWTAQAVCLAQRIPSISIASNEIV